MYKCKLYLIKRLNEQQHSVNPKSMRISARAGLNSKSSGCNFKYFDRGKFGHGDAKN